MCYAKYQNVNNISFKKLLTLSISIMMMIVTCDTLRPLGIYFRPFANSVHDTKCYKRRNGLKQEMKFKGKLAF